MKVTDEFKKYVKQQVSNAESYLDDHIRPQISENIKFYNGELPKPAQNGAKYVDDTCFVKCQHMLAALSEAFSAKDIVEVRADSSTYTTNVLLVNELIKDTLNVSNNREQVLSGWFLDALNSKNGILKVYKDIEQSLRKEYFYKLDATLLPQLLMQYEGTYDDVKQVITEEVLEYVESVNPITGEVIQYEQTTVDGYFEFRLDKEVIKIDNIRNENFIIDTDATRISDAKLVGHKAAVTISGLIDIGFADEIIKKVIEVYSNDTDDVDNNLASVSRRIDNYGSDIDEDTNDPLMKEVTLYELYIKTSLLNEDELVPAKLYKVFYVSGYVLSVEEVNRSPYVDVIPFGNAHNFWGESFVDKLKDIQTAKTGLIRSEISVTALAATPRYMFTEGRVDIRSLLSNKAGAHVALKDGGNISLMPTVGVPNGIPDLMNKLVKTSDDITGISDMNGGLLSDVLKTGGSTATASMALSQMQLQSKQVIKSFIHRGVEPLVRLIYLTVLEEFSQYKLNIDGNDIVINPSVDLPSVTDVMVRTELGSNIKLEKAMVLTNLRDSLMAQSATPIGANLVNAGGLFNLNSEILKLQGIDNPELFMNPPQAINQLEQMQQQLQQMQVQLQQLTQSNELINQENQQLKLVNNNRIDAELKLKQDKQITDAEIAADKQILADKEFKHKQRVDADKQALEEAKLKHNLTK